MLTWDGSKCDTTTNPIPVSAGILVNSSCKASSPPAEAPIPTIGKSVFPFWLGEVVFLTGSVLGDSSVLLEVCLVFGFAPSFFIAIIKSLPHTCCISTLPESAVDSRQSFKTSTVIILIIVLTFIFSLLIDC